MAGKRSKGKPAQPCMACAKKAKSRVRGCCRKCYLVLRRAIENGETSWEAAEEKGVCLPAGIVKTGRPRGDAKFIKLFPTLVQPANAQASAS